jgi:hypothetical protein
MGAEHKGANANRSLPDAGDWRAAAAQTQTRHTADSGMKGVVRKGRKERKGRQEIAAGSAIETTLAPPLQRSLLPLRPLRPLRTEKPDRRTAAQFDAPTSALAKATRTVAEVPNGRCAGR